MIKTKICITGASGFIGGAIAQYIASEVPEEFEIFSWDRNNPNDLGNSDIIIHCAARVHQMNDTAKNPEEEFHKGNYDLTMKLAHTALEKNIRKFIFLSTVKVYGETPGYYDETSPTSPTDPYADSKLKAENDLTELFKAQNQCQCVMFRLPMVYGPGNKGNILALLKMAKKRIPLPLKSVSNKRSMIYVNNICHAIISVLQSAKFPLPVASYILTDNSDISSRDLYSQIFHYVNNSAKGVIYVPQFVLRIMGIIGSLIKRLSGINLPLTSQVIDRLFNEYRFSCKKFTDDYNWNPKYTVADGLYKTTQWFLKNKKEK